ncbi:MAG: hypothetical protein AAFR81_09415 [Chloroflexota bacterium]
MVTLENTSVEEPVAEGSDLRVQLDPIHGGLRAAVFGSFVAAAIGGFGISAFVFPDLFFLSLAAGGASAAGASLGLERYLKNKWPSGREFVANAERIALTKHEKIELVVDPMQQVNVLMWYFKVRKDSPRAKKGWYLVALGLEQADTYIPIYTTVDPDTFAEMPLSNQFTKLEKRKRDKQKNSAITSSSNMKRAGEQRRLHEGEVVRQMLGGDMLYDDFVTTIEFLQANYPKWMPSD